MLDTSNTILNYKFVLVNLVFVIATVFFQTSRCYGRVPGVTGAALVSTHKVCSEIPVVNYRTPYYYPRETFSIVVYSVN